MGKIKLLFSIIHDVCCRIAKGIWFFPVFSLAQYSLVKFLAYWVKNIVIIWMDRNFQGTSNLCHYYIGVNNYKDEQLYMVTASLFLVVFFCFTQLFIFKCVTRPKGQKQIYRVKRWIYFMKTSYFLCCYALTDISLEEKKK